MTRRRRRWPLGIAVLAASCAGATFVGGGCSPFGIAASAEDGAAQAADAISERSDGAPAEADSSRQCVESVGVLVGNSIVDGRNPDSISPVSRDAYRFTVNETGNPRCAWIYVASPPADGKIHLGVYSEENGVPVALRASATFDSPKFGWQSAPLGMTLNLTKDEKLWIAVGPDRAVMLVDHSDSNDPACVFRSQRVPAGGTLPNPWTQADTILPGCKAAMYLAR